MTQNLKGTKRYVAKLQPHSHPCLAPLLSSSNLVSCPRSNYYCHVLPSFSPNLRWKKLKREQDPTCNTFYSASFLLASLSIWDISLFPLLSLMGFSFGPSFSEVIFQVSSPGPLSEHELITTNYFCLWECRVSPLNAQKIKRSKRRKQKKRCPVRLFM